MTVALADAKAAVRAMHRAVDGAPDNELANVLAQHTSDDWLWRGMHPLYEQIGADAVADVFWRPIRAGFGPLQRRADVFLAGANDVDDGQSTWVCEMGHLLGLHDAPWLDIPPTRKMCFLRYAEFNRVDDSGRIVESSMFMDIPSVMRQAGHDPFPPQTGSDHLHPGPMTHDGLLHDDQEPAAGAATMDLVNEMVADLSAANEVANRTGVNVVPYEVMARTWSEQMIWSGPHGIGATYTIDRYQQQHSYPFRFGLTDKIFNGHIARFAEGNYACFFGWANLTNTPTGGFLGMPASNPADMRVVDVYRRDGDKLAENWVFIDLLHWLSMQGLDVLARMRRQLGIERFGDTA
ncbi:MAG: nuclear transport factor 2 family protein [Actinomycetota bacterium]